MKNFILILLALLFFSCQFSRFPGYRKLDDSLYYRMIKLGDSNRKILSGDYLTLDLSYKTLRDSLFFHGVRKFHLQSDEQALFNKAMLKFSEGDSGILILSVSNFFNATLKRGIPAFLKDDDYIKLSFSVREIQSESDFEKEKRLFLKWFSEFESSENIKIENYLNNRHLDINPTYSGLYFMTLKEGQGEKVKAGKHVFVHYEGRFLNGKFLESTQERQEPIDYIYGQELFVVEGMDQAIGMMREGQKALIILPSDLAFGASGAGNGIVPPFSTLIYELEILKVE
jgi:FKBP-type peptidyl-prolyl cis-trans isomerase FkpA